MTIAVIIVNYGTAGLAIQAVQSVLERDGDGPGDTHKVEIHLVDNASPGKDQEILAAAHETYSWKNRVRFWPEAENHGFGRGNNVVLSALAARETPPDKVLLLNPDARLKTDVVKILSDALDANPGAGVAGASVELGNGSPGASKFRYPGFASELLQTLNFGPLNQVFGHYRVPLPADHPGGPVDWVSGTVLMFRFSALQEVGFFDPDFFLYFEETELQHRLGRAGYGAISVPEACVYHVQGAATGLEAKRTARRRAPSYLYQSRWLYFEKTRGRFLALILALCIFPAALFNIAHRRLRGRAPSLPLYFFRDHWQHGVWFLLTRLVST